MPNDEPHSKWTTPPTNATPSDPQTAETKTRSGTGNYELHCAGCGKAFTSPTFRKLCHKDCGRTRSRKSKYGAEKLKRQTTNDLQFIGVDGEGVQRPDGKHEYIMLSVGNSTLTNNGKQLTLGSILAHLWDTFTANPNAAYIGFFLGYDFDQWVRLMPQSVASSLVTDAGKSARTSKVSGRANPYPDAVVWADPDSGRVWEFDMLNYRRWRQRPHTCKPSKFNALCRNRTCGRSLDATQQSIVREEPGGERAQPETGTTGKTSEVDRQLVANGNPTDGTQPAGVSSVDAKNPRGASRSAPWMYVCDTGAFWQTSYLNVIHPSQWPDAPVCTQEEYDIVAAGKADRGAVVEYGETGFLAEMAQYNAMENDILARVTERLNIGFMNKDIPIKLDRAEWYGPGRAAQLWMDMLSKKLPEKQTIAQKDVYERVYPPVIEAAQATYYGGWFEQMAHGHVGDVWEYDINSAYPYIISRLPCLHHGVWTHGSTGTELFETYGDSAYTLVRASVKGSNPYIGCMPHRRLKGAICRPHNTAGWFWWHELIAATHAGVIDHVDVEEFWNYAPCDCPPPFNPVDIGIERMYRLRLQAGKNGPQGKAFKLVYNSSYGKTAQSVGSPKYSNPLYASLITAGTRAMILDAIATHPEGARAVTMVATDGIYFTSRHPNLNLNKTELGAWDETFKPNLTQMMPGVYWDDKTREGLARGEHPKLKSRGVSAKVIGAKINEIDTLWQEMQDAVSAGNPYEWPAITLQVPVLMTSAKLALHQGRWERAGAVQQGAERRISANPHDKRDTNSARLEDDILRTNPCVPEYIESVPYSRDFGYSDFADPMDDGYYQPNGDGVWADLQHFLGGGHEA